VANKTEHSEDHHGADALDLRRLRYFIALAEELHFGRAAEQLQVAQPPLSRLIGRIEADIGAQLIDRSRSQIRLTQAGKVLLARAREIIPGIFWWHQVYCSILQGVLRVFLLEELTDALEPFVKREQIPSVVMRELIMPEASGPYTSEPPCKSFLLQEAGRLVFMRRFRPANDWGVFGIGR
jgi:DNA-binding MarR family transcriptional regulator